jgi:hypothetical protein
MARQSGGMGWLGWLFDQEEKAGIDRERDHADQHDEHDGE